MMRRKTLNKDEAKVQYNRDVKQWLTENAPAHAYELEVCGTARGWWDTVSYLRSVGKSPAECGQVIANYKLS